MLSKFGIVIGCWLLFLMLWCGVVAGVLWFCALAVPFGIVLGIVALWLGWME